jgi:sterol desaturase/sphingolipid hydroxylase (fatty acid hydroxylase superfamily)
MSWLDMLYAWQDVLFDRLVAPALFHLGLGNRLELAYDAMDWFSIGLVQVLIIALVFVPLERLWPAETSRWNAQVRVDIIYTLIHRLGVFSVVFFFTLEPLVQSGLNALRIAGVPTWNIDQIWPGVTDVAWVSFVIYLVVLDLIGYFYHRLQHQFAPLWALHALHHSQRQMTAWSDNRNHLLDDVLHGVVMSFIALLIGVEPSQFLVWVALTQLLESLQHANLRLTWGRLGERLLVSPRFHRLHHAIGIGHEFKGAEMGGHNFGVLFPWWDLMFGTARIEDGYHATGIRDQVETGRDYGTGFWRQQWLGLARLVDSFKESEIFVVRRGH